MIKAIQRIVRVVWEKKDEEEKRQRFEAKYKYEPKELQAKEEYIVEDGVWA